MEIGRNSIIVRNMDQESEAFKKLFRRFSIYDPVLHKYTFTAFTVINNDVYIPASIGIRTIKGILGSEEPETFVFNLSAKAETINYIVKYEPRDLLQEEALKFLRKMKKDKNRERLISLETGKGKTYITIKFISELQKKPMIVVDNLALAEQWKKEFLKHTDLNDSDIVFISGKESIEKELTNRVGKVYIAIHRTLSNLIEEDPFSINKLMNDLHIGIRVFDECHVEFRNICQVSSLSNVEYTIFLSATPSRSKYTDDTLYGKIFRNIPYFNGKNIENNKYHTVIISNFDSQPTFEIKSRIKTKYGFSSARWAAYITEDEIAYNNYIAKLEKIILSLKLLERKKKTFIMLPTIELIKKTKKDLLNDLQIDAGLFIGEVKKTRKEELEKLFVLTNDKIFDKGIDVQDMEVLINFVPFSSLVKTEQIIGRLRYNEERSSILIDVTDFGFKETKEQLKTRKKFYKNKAKKILIEK